MIKIRLSDEYIIRFHLKQRDYIWIFNIIMAHFLANISKGINHRVKKIFYRRYGVFSIGWTKEKILKHQTDQQLKYHIYQNKYRIGFRDAPVFFVSIDELFVREFYKFRADNDRPKIIDCGSYIGTSILYFKDNYPKP